MSRRKQNGGRSEKRHRPISLLESALIFKNAKVYSCSENGKDFLYVAQRHAGAEDPVYTIKKHTQYKQFDKVFY